MSLDPIKARARGLGAELRYIAKAKRRSAPEIARRSGLAVATVKNVFGGHTRLRRRSYEQLLAGIGLDEQAISELLAVYACVIFEDGAENA